MSANSPSPVQTAATTHDESVQPVHQARCVVYCQSTFLQAEGVLAGLVAAVRQYQAGHA